jgi:hypothetical protein
MDINGVNERGMKIARIAPGKEAEPQVTFDYSSIFFAFKECLLQRFMSSLYCSTWINQMSLSSPASRLRLYRFLSSGLRFPISSTALLVPAYYHNLLMNTQRSSLISQGSVNLIYHIWADLSIGFGCEFGSPWPISRADRYQWALAHRNPNLHRINRTTSRSYVRWRWH